jgi:hypothetical protein
MLVRQGRGFGRIEQVPGPRAASGSRWCQLEFPRAAACGDGRRDIAKEISSSVTASSHSAGSAMVVSAGVSVSSVVGKIPVSL